MEVDIQIWGQRSVKQTGKPPSTAWDVDKGIYRGKVFNTYTRDFTSNGLVMDMVKMTVRFDSDVPVDNGDLVEFGGKKYLLEGRADGWKRWYNGSVHHLEVGLKHYAV